jgi:glyoxylase-like metal-dependent hydrolase (beta-lactamase superfamily II)
MKAIAENVFVEDSFAGVVLGAIRLEQGMLFIDAPLLPRDAQVWRSSLTKSGSGSERLLILLDEHLDRSIGAKAMKCTVVAHERSAQVLGSRPASAKPIPTKTGSLWENADELGSIHAILPEITFTHSMQIHWGSESVVLEYHPGPSRGATWIVLPDQKIAFVGDCVLNRQPPFLASSDLNAWTETLSVLHSTKYRDYILISSRGGIINQEEVREQATFLKHVQGQLEKLAQNKSDPSIVETLIPELMKGFNPRNQKEDDFFRSRLLWGLQQLYSNHYHPSAKTVTR